MAEKTYDLSTFQLKRILNNNSKVKTISVLGTFPSEQSADITEPAIVVLEKTAFTDFDVNTQAVGDTDGTQRRYFSLETRIKQEFINDIYGNFQCFPIPAINSNFSIISFNMPIFLFFECSSSLMFMWAFQSKFSSGLFPFFRH